MTDALIGKQLNNFRIERLLGRGGMASVYYGIDVGLNRPIAMKVIDERWQDVEQLTDRFISEAQTIATWRHENIIQVYYAGNEDDIYYFVMEYIDGKDLTAYLHVYHERQQYLPYDEVTSILNAVASGLDYAHSKGVIHRDVKPSNIMISSSNRVVLMDFGLALDTQKGTIGESFGTPHYIAPEQAQDPSKAVAQSDQYALGVIAYEMLTGQVPFDSPSAMSVALMHMQEAPPKPTSINPRLTSDVENVLLKVLNKDPSSRFPSCQSFVETLEHSIAGRPTLIEDINPAQLGNILITPHPESDVGTIIGIPQDKSIDMSQSPTQHSRHNRLPFTLVAVFAFVLVGIGAIIALGSSANPVGGNALPTVDSQLLDAATEDVRPSKTPEEEPTVTDIPTETRQPTTTDMPPTVTQQPTDTPIPPSATEQPTETDIPPTATPLPTVTPMIPSPVSIPAPLPPTLAFPGGSPVVLYYNDNSFYIWNPTSARIRASRFKFEGLDGDGNIVPNMFDGLRWTQYYSFIDGGNCVAIEMTVGTQLEPEGCGSYNAIVNTTAYSDIVFWTQQNANVFFRVLWDDKEIARCELTHESCTFNIP